jgi:hypothetical protein
VKPSNNDPANDIECLTRKPGFPIGADQTFHDGNGGAASGDFTNKYIQHGMIEKDSNRGLSNHGVLTPAASITTIGNGSEKGVA